MKRLAFAILAVVTIVALPAAQQPDRSKAPAVGPPPELKLPAIQKRQLSNGLPVWVVEMHGVPVAQVNLVVYAGSDTDAPGKFGLANLTVSMLEEGAAGRSALEIADAVDFLGADLRTTSGSDASGVRLHVPVARLAEALPIMADLVERPTFPKEDLERVRAQRLTQLIQVRDDPATIAQLAFARALYGTTHRYGTAQLGTAQTIRSFTPEDLRAFYTAQFRPSNSALVVVGDVTPDGVMPLLETQFGKWQVAGSAPQRPTLPTPAQPAARQIFIVDKPGAPQSQIRIGWIGVPRSTPDYFPIQVMNTILGASYTSRLNMNLREKHGYTYGAGSGFDMRLSAGPFAASAGVQTDKTVDALKEFFNELNAIRQPVAADELSRAKNYVSLRFPGRFETTSDFSQRLEEALIYKLPDDYFSRYVANIEAVTAADVKRVAEKYIVPGRFVVVVVGDRMQIESGIRALNYGPVKLMTVDDVFGPAPSLGRATQ